MPYPSSQKQKVANILSIDRSSARSTVPEAVKRDNPEDVEEKPRGGACNVKVDDDMRTIIAEALGRNPVITLRNVNL